MSNSEISDKDPSKNKRYYCNDCVCGFNTLQHYNYHLESKKHKIRISKEATLHICSICQKNFSYLSNLYRHRSKCKENLVKDPPKVDLETEIKELRKEIELFKTEKNATTINIKKQNNTTNNI